MPFKGTETILFDPNEGIVVKYDISVTGSGVIEIVSLGMEAGFTMTIKGNLELK
jgi:hypothetical protein